MSKRRAIWLAGFLSSAAIAGAGCATGPTINNNASNTTTTVGNTVSSVDVRLGLSLGIGDAVSKAAADAVKGIMAPTTGLAAALTPEKKEEAVQKALSAGIDQAKKEGVELTDDKKANIEKAARDCVEAEAKKAEPAPANP